MNEHVYKTIEITGSSHKGPEDAIRVAIEKASQSVHNMRWFKVIETRGNIDASELRLADLSAVVHMSPYHFARLFKRSTGVPPHQFLLRHRIDEARELLAAQRVPIAEIARSVGFRTPSHFTTTFRRVTGMTPSAYRSSGAEMTARP